MGFPGDSVLKNPPSNSGDAGDMGRPLGWKERQPTPVFLPGKPHGQKSLAAYSPWSHKRLGHDYARTPNPIYL